MAEVQKYRVKPGQRHYMRDQKGKRGSTCYTGGQIVKLTPAQARPFRDKLIPVTETEDKIQKQEAAPTPEFYSKHSGAGKYNVFSATQPDTALNESPMTKKEAEDAVAKLLKGEEVKLRDDEDDDPLADFE